MTGGTSIIGIVVLVALGFISALFSMAPIFAGVVAGSINAHRAMMVIGGLFAVGLTWGLRPLLFTVLDGAALTLNLVWLFAAGAVWTVGTQMAWGRFRPTDKRVL